MIALFKTGDLPAPPAVDKAPVGDVADAGYVTPSFAVGTLLLRDADGRFMRLVWHNADDKDRRRAVPAGTYTVAGYTLTRRDAAGKEWHLAGTGKMIAKVKVAAGATHPLKLDESIHVKLQPKSQGNAVTINVGVMGEHHCGLSIYRDGKRIPLDWRITGDSKQVLASGTIDYG